MAQEAFLKENWVKYMSRTLSTRSFYRCIISLPERREQSLHFSKVIHDFGCSHHVQEASRKHHDPPGQVSLNWNDITSFWMPNATRQDYIQPKNILAPACVHYLKRTGIMQISLRYLLWNVRINAAYSNIVVAVVDRRTRGTGWLPTR